MAKDARVLEMTVVTEELSQSMRRLSGLYRERAEKLYEVAKTELQAVKAGPVEGIDQLVKEAATHNEDLINIVIRRVKNYVEELHMLEDGVRRDIFKPEHE